MNEFFLAILYQALGYALGIGIGFGVCAFFMRGFLFKFLAVRASFGKKALVRVHNVTHIDYYVGRFDEGDLVIGKKDKAKRINNIQADYVYRSMNLNWIDLDGKTWAVVKPNLDGVTGFDPEKQESLITRALYKPPIDDIKQKVIYVMIIAAIAAGAASAYFSFQCLNSLDGVMASLDSLRNGLVVATGG